MLTMANFDKIAPWYDWLTGLVFGNRIRRAQTALLDAIEAPDNWLIVGGGTGWILDEIASRFPQARITYLDNSQKMIQLAQQRNAAHELQVSFRLGTVDTLSAEESFDLIFTPFFLDLFTNEELARVCQKLDAALRPGGVWLVADFSLPDGLFRSLGWLLIRAMYAFFGFVSGLTTRQLPDYQANFSKTYYRLCFHHKFVGGLIESKVFLKS